MKPAPAIIEVTATRPPAWFACDFCENFICSFHHMHAHDCDCPSLETWLDFNLCPYDDPHPGEFWKPAEPLAAADQFIDDGYHQHNQEAEEPNPYHGTYSED